MNSINDHYFPPDRVALKTLDYLWEVFVREVKQNRRRYGDALSQNNLPPSISRTEFQFAVPYLLETYWVKHHPNDFNAIILCSKRLPMNSIECSAYLGIVERNLESLMNHSTNPMPTRMTVSYTHLTLPTILLV